MAHKYLYGVKLIIRFPKLTVNINRGMYTRGVVMHSSILVYYLPAVLVFSGLKA